MAPAGEFRVDSRLIAWTLCFAARSRKRVYSHRRLPRARPAIPEVLPLIAQGLSNQEIGQRLFLALNTVKAQSHGIFDKLLVQHGGGEESRFALGQLTHAMPNVTIQVEGAFQADPVRVGGVAMTFTSPRTIEATYVNGLLRPLEPIRDSEDQVYFVTILNIGAIRSGRRSQTATSLRGKYRGYLSSADEFAGYKQAEKALER